MNNPIALSVEQMQQLKSRGVDIDNASMVYSNVHSAAIKDSNYYLLGINHFNNQKKDVPAFTLQDIFNLLPNVIRDTEYEGERCNLVKIFNNTLEYRNLRRNMPLISTEGSDILEASYNMLIWCLDNNIIKTKKPC